MPVTNGKGTKNKGAGKKANSETAGPGGSFPIGDDKHARLAISGATRSANAGNISEAEAAKIKAKARAKLGSKSGSSSTPTKKKCPGCGKMSAATKCPNCGRKLV